MADIKLKDFVDEESFKKLVELDGKITSIKETYAKAADELAKGLTVEVRCKGDLDKLQNVYNTQMRNVSSASESLTEVLRKQSEVAEQLMKKIKEKADAENLSTKEVKELSKATVEASKALQQATKAEEAMNKAQRAANTTRKTANMTEDERIRTIKEALALADKQVHSIEEANEANKRLRQAVKMVRDTDEDYKNTLGKLNATIGVNTDYVKRNSDRYTQQKMTIGSYREEIKAAVHEIRSGNESIKNMGVIARSAGHMMQNNLAVGIKSVNIGISNMVKGYVGAQGIIMAIQKFIGQLHIGIQKIISFEAANSKLAAVLGSTQEGVKELTTDAKRLGATTKYTASQVTELQIELAKLGFTRNEILQSTEAVLKFAQATGSELGEAASLTGAALRMFGATTKESERYVSAMAVSTARSALSFQYLATALPIVGPVAKAFNFTIEDTLALVGKLADAGFDASMAATATRNIFLNLADSSGKLAKALGRPVTNIGDLVAGLKELREKGIDLNSTLELTDKRSVAAFNAFLTAADGVSELREKVTGVKDELNSMADVMGDNVQGALAGASSAWESLVLTFYKGKGMMKEIIEQFAIATRGYAYMLKSWEDLQTEADNQWITIARKELTNSDEVEKHINNMKKLYNENIALGMSAEEAQEKAKSEYLESLKSRLDIENKEYQKAIDKRISLEDEYNNRSLLTILASWKRTNNVIKSEIKDSIDEAAGKKGVASITESIIDELGSFDLIGKNGGGIKELTEKQKDAIIKAEYELQQSKVNLMREGYEKEVASIRINFEKKISAIKGNNEAEINLRTSLEREMEKKLAEVYDSYVLSRNKENVKNELAIVKKGSDEELAIRLQLMNIEKIEELKTAEEKGVDRMLIEAKYARARNELLGEYASLYVERIAENAAAEQVVRTSVYNAELHELEKLYAKKEITEIEYEKRKGEITDKYSVETARYTVEVLEKQVAVEELTAEDRETIMKKLTEAKVSLAEAEAEAEIAAIKRTEKVEEQSYEKRKKNIQKWLDISSEAVGKISGVISAVNKSKLDDLEKQQEANDEAYQADIERIELLEENGVISKEEAEARKRMAEEKTAKKNEELEKRKIDIQQKQAKWDKAVHLALTGIATARGIMEAMAMRPPNPILASVIGAMGAVQAATIVATPIPAYKEGTKNGGHIGGLAIVGDGGKQEIIVYGGKGWITPDTPTVVDLPKGAEVFPDIESFENLNLNLSLLGNNKTSPVIVNDYSELSREMRGVRSDLKKIARQQHRDAYNAQYELYKRNRL